MYSSRSHLTACLVLCTLPTFAQSPATSAAGGSNSIERAIELAAKRDCDAAVPLLNEHTAQITDKKVRYRALLATARCGIRQKDGKATVNALIALRHDNPQD